MTENKLKVRGARHHNLKNLDVEIPKNSLVVISGLSGSGKSTLAFDTIYAEGQRRYVESLSAYARQFLEMMDKPDVDSIEGLSPAISIQQKTTSKNPRSTVGTTTEIYDYMRLLFARIGTPHCTNCDRQISSQSVETICDSILRDFAKKKILVLAPLIQRKKGTHEKIFEQIKRDGYSRMRVDGEVLGLDEPVSLERQKWHSIEIVVDRIKVTRPERSRLFEAVQTAINASKGDVIIASDGTEAIFSQRNACPHCGVTIGELEPRNFSFNSPFGMCKACSGLGVNMEFDPDLVIPDKTLSLTTGAIAPWNTRYSSHYMSAVAHLASRHGISIRVPIEQLDSESLGIILYGSNNRPGNGNGHGSGEGYGDGGSSSGETDGWYPSMSDGVLSHLKRSFAGTDSEAKRLWLRQFMMETLCDSCRGRKLNPESLNVRINGKGIIDVCDLPIDQCLDFFGTIRLTDTEAYIARDILKEIRERLEFLLNVGLNYLTLNRSSATLSGGESQRIRLATQIGSNLTGVLYVLDEPTIGLHQRDNRRLIKTLSKLRNLGNTVIIVEHDEEVIRSSDWIVDLGPGAGVHGGSVVFEGKIEQILDSDTSVTGRYLDGRSSITLKDRIRNRSGSLVIKNASENNLKGVDVEIPLGLFVSVTGVSGSGKSSLVNGILLKSLMKHFYKSSPRPGRHDEITGLHDIDKVIAIDQSPIGRTPRSNPVTYIGAFTPIRDLYARTELSRRRGYAPGQFSFNVHAGRCFACSGNGVKQIEMQFLSDVFVRCNECMGKRYSSETLSVLYKGKNISDILGMTVYEALQFFENVPPIRKKLQTIYDVGLGYIKLGQSSTTLSGGEAQRVKLASELSKTNTGRTLYILDEPTTGLHFADVQNLLDVLNRLVNMGNTAVVIEHNMDVIRNSDWIIDLGPEGGDEGGQIVCTGTPDDVARAPGSYTGRYLKKMLKNAL